MQKSRLLKLLLIIIIALVIAILYLTGQGYWLAFLILLLPAFFIIFYFVSGSMRRMKADYRQKAYDKMPKKEGDIVRKTLAISSVVSSLVFAALSLLLISFELLGIILLFLIFINLMTYESSRTHPESKKRKSLAIVVLGTVLGLSFVFIEKFLFLMLGILSDWKYDFSPPLLIFLALTGLILYTYYKIMLGLKVKGEKDGTSIIH